LKFFHMAMFSQHGKPLSFAYFIFLGIIPEITQRDSYKKLNKIKKIQNFNIF
jgi:hypothetical protein